MKLADFDEKFFFQWILWTLWINFAWEFYLRWRQLRVYRTRDIRPNSLIGIVSEENFQKARLYALDRCIYAMFEDVFGVVITTWLIYIYAFPKFWDIAGHLLNAAGARDIRGYSLFHNAAFAGVFNIFNTIIKLPFSVYYTFVLEERHGFNKQTAWFFTKDTIKKIIIEQILMGIIIICITYIVQIGGKYLFAYLFAFTALFTFFMLMIYPSVIAPLFDKYTPLPEGNLRTEIEKLAASIEFPLYKLYIIEGSKRSSHSNAYLYGLFNSKRIVLFDTLLKNDEGKGCENDEILAILGHELGHWKLSHVAKNLVIMFANILLLFIIFQWLIDHAPLYSALGFADPAPTFVKLMAVFQFVLSPYFAVFGLFSAIISRRFEFAADTFAKQLGRTAALKAALIKLNADNLGFPIYDPWYSAWQNSHPPLMERLEALDKTD